jgi:hypothetical protein
MTCERHKLSNGAVAIVCSRKRRKPAPICSICEKFTATQLCDHKTGRKLCSAPMCEDCTRRIGDKDFCPAHLPPPQIPLLDTLNEACRQAKAIGWTHGELRARLIEADARWDKDGLVDVPEGKTAALLSHLKHHPSWRHSSAGYCDRLRRQFRLSYDDLAGACEALKWTRPSLLDDAGRAALMVLVEDRTSALWAEIEESRQADAALKQQKKGATTPGGAAPEASTPAPPEAPPAAEPPKEIPPEESPRYCHCDELAHPHLHDEFPGGLKPERAIQAELRIRMVPAWRYLLGLLKGRLIELAIAEAWESTEAREVLTAWVDTMEADIRTDTSEVRRKWLPLPAPALPLEAILELAAVIQGQLRRAL